MVVSRRLHGIFSFADALSRTHTHILASYFGFLDAFNLVAAFARAIHIHTPFPIECRIFIVGARWPADWMLCDDVLTKQRTQNSCRRHCATSLII